MIAGTPLYASPTEPVLDAPLQVQIATKNCSLARTMGVLCSVWEHKSSINF